MRKQARGNWVYIFWFLFNFIILSIFTVGIIIPFYLVTVPLAFTSLAEKLWRKVTGVKPLSSEKDKERLLPLLMEVYGEASKTDLKLYNGIELFVCEDMSINAFAFGKTTLALNRGSIELLSDDNLKGLIAHELGHFSHKDTKADLLAAVSNLFMSFVINRVQRVRNEYAHVKRDEIVMSTAKRFYNFLYYIFRIPQFLGDLILLGTSRKHEYYADDYATEIGYGKELSEVLTKIKQAYGDEPKGKIKQLKSTHPHLASRIERLESATE